MILLRHAKRIAHDFGRRGMASPGLYSGFFYSVRSHQKAKTRCANSGLSNQN